MLARVLRDLIWCFILPFICLPLSLMINYVRSDTLPFVYFSKGLSEKIEAPGLKSTDEKVSLIEIQSDVQNKRYIILDARPEVFFDLGHIPGAFSLPRDDFKKQLSRLQSALKLNAESRIIVYCSGSSCEDSQLVAEQLKTVGYFYVRIFQGGMDEWEAANLPEDKNDP